MFCSVKLYLRENSLIGHIGFIKIILFSGLWLFYIYCIIFFSGLEKSRPNLLLGLAIVQKSKRAGSLPQEVEEKRPKVNMSKDPMWIPKPPVLYGSDKLEVFQPYDPETPVSSSPPGSPSCPGSPSDSSSSGSISIPSLMKSIKATPSVLSKTTTESTTDSNSSKNSTSASSNKNPLQTILKTLFKGKQSDSMISTDESPPAVSVKKTPVLSQMSGSMIDPIVQQYGQKSKIKDIEEEKENDFDRPYDPEEEYDPAKRYKMFPTQATENVQMESSEISHEDDVAYDPEDETIFEEFQSDVASTKPAAPTQNSDSSSCPAPVSSSTPAQSPSPVVSLQPNLAGTIVVSAATLSEQQRMLEELNKQIEEQKRQLKEQEEALRQQREAVGMFMAHFSVSDSLMSPPTKALPLSQQSSGQDSTKQTESKTSDKADMPSIPTKPENKSTVKSETLKPEETTDGQKLKDEKNTVLGEAGIPGKECDKESSAGEIEDSDIAYDPEDESLFDEIQEDVFKGGTAMTNESFSKAGQSSSYKGVSPNSPHSKKRRSSPKRRSRHEREHHRSPSRRSQQRSRSRSRRHRDKDRHRRSEGDRSRHRIRDLPERSGHYRKDRSTRRHSRGRRRSSSSPRKKHSASLSPKPHRRVYSQVIQVIEKTKEANVSCDAPVKSEISSVAIKNDPDGIKLECSQVENCSELSPESVYKIKMEISESSDCQKLEMEKVSFSHDDNSVSGNCSQEKKLSLQETFFHDKYESTIPLREIDPPIRDSPESPDPDPQLVKPSSIEKNDCAKSEENRDPEEDNSASMPQEEGKCLPIGGLAIQGAGHETDTLSEFSRQGAAFQYDSKPNINESEHSGTHIDVWKTEIRLPWPRPGILNRVKEKQVVQQEASTSSLSDIPGESDNQHQNSKIIDSWTAVKNQMVDIENTSLKDVNQSIKNPCSDLKQNLEPSALNPPMAESSVQNERETLFMKSQVADRTAPDSWLLGSRDSSSVMHHSTETMGHGNETSQNISCLQNLPYLETKDFRPKSESLDGRSSTITGSFEKTNFQPHGGDSNLSILGHGQNSGTMANITNPDWRGPGPRYINQNKSLGSLERHPDQNVPRSDTWKDPNQGGFDPVREGPFLQNDWSGQQLDGKRPNLDSQGSNREGFRNLEYRNLESKVSPKIQNLRHDETRVRPDFMRPRQETRAPQMHFPRHDRSQHIGQNSTEQGFERRNPNIGGPGLRVSGPDFMDPGHDGRKLPMECPETDRRESIGPHFEESGPRRHDLTVDRLGSDKSGSTGPNFKVPWLERRGPHGSESDRRDPIMEGLGTDRRVDQNVRGIRPISAGPESGGLFKLDGPINRRTGLERRGKHLEVTETERCTGGPDFREVRPEGRGLSMAGAEQYRPRPRDQEFRRLGEDKRSITMEDHGPENRRCEGPVFRGPGSESRFSPMETPGQEKRNTRGPDFSSSTNKMRGPDIDKQDSDRRGPRVPDIWRPEDQVRPQSREDGAESGYPNFEDLGHNRKGPVIRGPLSDMAGPTLNRKGLGHPRTGRPGPQHKLVNTSLRPDRRCPEDPNIREPWQEEVSLDMNETPHGSQFRYSESGRSPPNMEGLQSSRGAPNFKGMRPNRTFMEGQRPIRKGPGDFIGPGNESRGSDIEIPFVDRHNTGDASFRESVPKRPYPEMKDTGPNWKESGGLDCRGQGFRQQVGAEVLRNQIQNDWEESEPISDIPDSEFTGSDQTFRNFRPSRPMRGNMRGRRPRVRGFTRGRSGEGFEGQWLDRRGPNREALENEREHSGDSWENSCNLSSEPFEDVSREQEQNWQGRSNKWRDAHEEQSMHAPGPIQDPEVDWNGPGCRGPGAVQDNSDNVCPEFSRGGQRHEWREHNREGSGPFFRGEGGPGNRGQIYDRGRGRGRGPSIQKPLYMGNDRTQQNFRGNMRDSNVDIPGAHRRGPDFMNFCPKRKEFEMEGQGSSDLECSEPGYRTSDNENQGFNEENSDFGELESKRFDEDMEDRQTGFEHNFRRERGAPKMRRQRPGTGPSKADMRRWDSSTDFPESSRRGPDMRDRDREHGALGQTSSRERRCPHQVTESHNPRERPSALFNRSLGPGPNRGENIFPGFDNTQSPQVVQPPRHRGALLPTPKKCISLPPNHITRNCETQQSVHPTMRESSRGRAVDYRFRGRARSPRRGGPPGRNRAIGEEEVMEEGN